MAEKLPSIDEFYPELPSVDDLITEEKLPSVDEFIEEEKEKEEEEEKPDLAPSSYEPDLTEVIRLINDVREDIPEIPQLLKHMLEEQRLRVLTTHLEKIVT